MTVTAEQAKAMLDAATGERWHWAGDIKTRGPELSTWIPGQGRTTVVAAQRLGMRGGQLTFNVDGLLTASSTLAIREAPYRDDVKDIDHPDARLIAAAPDLAATVVELHERLATVEAERDELQDQVLTVQTSSAYDLGHQHGELTGGKWKRERDKLARWKAEAKIVIAGWNQVWEDAGRPGALGESTSVATAKHIAALQAAIDKVLALHTKTTEEMLDHKCADGDCEHEDECPSILVDVCGCCAGIALQVSDEYWPAAMDEITWPCETVQALTQGGEGS